MNYDVMQHATCARDSFKIAKIGVAVAAANVDVVHRGTSLADKKGLAIVPRNVGATKRYRRLITHTGESGN